LITTFACSFEDIDLIIMRSRNEMAVMLIIIELTGSDGIDVGIGVTVCVGVREGVSV
jgi:hypothetical protein